jgi:hypothetical protein
MSDFGGFPDDPNDPRFIPDIEGKNDAIDYSIGPGNEDNPIDNLVEQYNSVSEELKNPTKTNIEKIELKKEALRILIAIEKLNIELLDSKMINIEKFNSLKKIYDREKKNFKPWVVKKRENLERENPKSPREEEGSL